MRMTVIPIVVRALGIVLKDLERGLEGLEFEEIIETMQTTALLKSARILRRCQETRRNLLLFS